MATNAADREMERTQTADGYSGPRKRDFTRLAEGTLVGRYRAGAMLGEGGQGVVYRGEHLTLGYPVAIKVMHVSQVDVCAARRARFRREARLGAKLQHRHVVKVLEAGELEDGSPYLVMEYVEGTSLADLIARTTLPAPAVTELGLQLLSAITAINEHGILHRDIKPENIMLERTVDGAVMAKVLDFGVSKTNNAELGSRTLTQDGTVLGTPYYMSPEHVRGKELDVRADLYAVSAVLFECLTGQPPHDGPTTSAVFAKIASEPVVPVRTLAPGCPEALAQVIDKGLCFDRKDRWHHPLMMAEGLRSVALRLALPREADAWAAILESPDGHLGTCAVQLSRLATPKGPVTGLGLGAGFERAVAWARDHGRALRWGTAAAALGLVTLLTAWTWPSEARTPAKQHEVAMLSAPAEIAAAPDAPQAEAPPIGVEPPAPESSDPATEAERESTEARETDPTRERAARRGPSPELLERRARQAFVRGHSDQAMRLYRQALEADRRRSSAWRGIGLVASASGDTRLASRALRRYLAMEPNAADRASVERELARLR